MSVETKYGFIHVIGWLRHTQTTATATDWLHGSTSAAKHWILNSTRIESNRWKQCAYINTEKGSHTAKRECVSTMCAFVPAVWALFRSVSASKRVWANVYQAHKTHGDISEYRFLTLTRARARSHVPHIWDYIFRYFIMYLCGIILKTVQSACVCVWV